MEEDSNYKWSSVAAGAATFLMCYMFLAEMAAAFRIKEQSLYSDTRRLSIDNYREWIVNNQSLVDKQAERESAAIKAAKLRSKNLVQPKNR